METDDRRDPINSLDLADLEERRMARPTYNSGTDKQSSTAKSDAMPGSRRLLARLRDVMAGSGSPQERLDNTGQGQHRRGAGGRARRGRRGREAQRQDASGLEACAPLLRTVN